jgi:hypothetical protein
MYEFFRICEIEQCPLNISQLEFWPAACCCSLAEQHCLPNPRISRTKPRRRQLQYSNIQPNGTFPTGYPTSVNGSYFQEPSAGQVLRRRQRRSKHVIGTVTNSGDTRDPAASNDQNFFNGNAPVPSRLAARKIQQH